MFLHIGNGKNIREKYILGVFDMDNSTVSSVTRKYLSNSQKAGNIISVSNELPKSFIVYREGDKVDIYFSPLSTSALMGRMS